MRYSGSNKTFSVTPGILSVEPRKGKRGPQGPNPGPIILPFTEQIPYTTYILGQIKEYFIGYSSGIADLYQNTLDTAFLFPIPTNGKIVKLQAKYVADFDGADVTAHINLKTGGSASLPIKVASTTTISVINGVNSFPDLKLNLPVTNTDYIGISFTVEATVAGVKRGVGFANLNIVLN